MPRKALYKCNKLILIIKLLCKQTFILDVINNFNQHSTKTNKEIRFIFKMDSVIKLLALV